MALGQNGEHVGQTVRDVEPFELLGIQGWNVHTMDPTPPASR